MCCPTTANYPHQPTTEATPPLTNLTWTHQCSAFSRSPTFAVGAENNSEAGVVYMLHQRWCQPFQFIVQAIIGSPSALLPSKSKNKSNDATKQEIVVSNTNFIIIIVILLINQCQFLLTRYNTLLLVIHHRQLSSVEVSQHHYMIALNI